MATTLTPVYGAAKTLTMTLASLASDANLLAGRECTAANQNTDQAVDAMVGGRFQLGTSPTTAKQVEVWAIGSYDGVVMTAGATGVDANFAPVATSKPLMKLLQIIPTDAVSNHVYPWGPLSVAQAFGGTLPLLWSIFIVHNTGVAFAASGTFEVKYTPVKYQSA
jgi:hypothetical protein